MRAASLVSRQELSSPHPSNSASTRFVDHFETYLDAVVEQAADRDCNSVRSIDDYLHIRRHTVGVMPSLDVLQFEMDSDLPDSVVHHPRVLQLVDLATEMVIIENVCSSQFRVIAWQR